MAITTFVGLKYNWKKNLNQNDVKYIGRYRRIISVWADKYSDLHCVRRTVDHRVHQALNTIIERQFDIDEAYWENV